MKISKISFIFASFISFAFSACGGGGSSSDGSIVHGTLTQLSSGAHSTSGHSTSGLELRHSAGQNIDGVTICLLGECSVTDATGEWGVNVPEIPAGDILLTAKGHGIDSSLVINVPGGAADVTVVLGNSSEGISLTSLIVDGVDHTDHDHNHAEGETSGHAAGSEHADSSDHSDEK